MKQRIRLTVILSAMAVSLLAAADATDTESRAWTLAAAMEETRANNPDAAMALERLEGARSLIAEADSAWMPQVWLRSGYSQTDQPLMAFGTILNTGTFNPGINFNQPGTVDNFQASAVVAYNLYSGGRHTAQHAAARAGEEAALADHTAVLESLSLAVVRTFHGILQANEGVAALESAVESLQESQRVAHARFEQGQLLRNELLDIEVQLAETEVRLMAARHAVLLTERSFLVLLGRKPEGRVQLVADAGFDAPPPGPEEGAPFKRPELEATRARLTAADETIEAVRGEHRPIVDLFASYQYDKGWRMQGDGNSWLAGIRVEWPIFDGGRTSARVRRSMAERSGIREAERKLILQLQMEYEQARLAHELARNQLEVSGRLVEQAGESAAISRARFEAGDLLATELIGAETRLVEARMRRAVARANERIAAAELRRAAGLPLL